MSNEWRRHFSFIWLLRCDSPCCHHEADDCCTQSRSFVYWKGQSCKPEWGHWATSWCLTTSQFRAWQRAINQCFSSSIVFFNISTWDMYVDSFQKYWVISSIETTHTYVSLLKALLGDFLRCCGLPNCYTKFKSSSCRNKHFFHDAFLGQIICSCFRISTSIKDLQKFEWYFSAFHQIFAWGFQSW